MYVRVVMYVCVCIYVYVYACIYVRVVMYVYMYVLPSKKKTYFRTFMDRAVNYIYSNTYIHTYILYIYN